MASMLVVSRLKGIGETSRAVLRGMIRRRLDTDGNAAGGDTLLLDRRSNAGGGDGQLLDGTRDRAALRVELADVLEGDDERARADALDACLANLARLALLVG